jgi:hypothetical protein
MMCLFVFHAAAGGVSAMERLRRIERENLSSFEGASLEGVLKGGRKKVVPPFMASKDKLEQQQQQA